jgi:hypothetical protein
MKMSKALAAKDEAQFMVLANPGAAIEALKSNLDGETLSPFDLDRVTIPAGGGSQWCIPTLEGEQVAAEITGVIVAVQNCRAYWQESFDSSGGGTPPDCVSEDVVTGIGNPGGVCQKCPMAAFGSDNRGKGQACKQIKRLFLLRPDSMLPLVVTLPPTSIRPAQRYLLRLAGRGLKYQGVVTRITLEKEKNSGGIAYSKAVFGMVAALDAGQAKVMEDYVKEVAPSFSRKVTADDFPAGEAE